ncbi:MAG: pyruvate dehydrogenase complex dihydrolipoamide acetyltransferase [Pseudomonadota bacterium]
MPINILMPALSPTMEEGKLAKWLVAEGDEVTSGMVIAEIETDKATMEVEAVEEGHVGKILIDEGAEGVKVNTPIAVLLEDGEDASAIGDGAANPSASQTPTAEAAETTTSSSIGGAQVPAASGVAGVQASALQSATESPPAASASAAATTSSDGKRIFVSPLARRLASENGLDLSLLTGSGPRGRIVQRDIEKAIETGVGKAGSAAPMQIGTALATTGGSAGQSVGTIKGMSDDEVLALYDAESYEVRPHDGMRKIIAQRLTQSKQTVPHFYQTVDCRLDDLLAARSRMNASSPKDGPRAFKLSVNDFIIKAMALALQDVPNANATWTEQGMLIHRNSDVGVAVAVEGGLFTPIIRHAELKTLSEISNEMKDLAARARNRRLAPHEYQGGTTSISNLGMFGIKAFDAVINPPHGTILAVGAGIQQPVVSDGKVDVATVMSCTLSCDHRVVDGALGAELLSTFKSFIEDPVRMLV